MPFVLDPSIPACWAFEDEDHPAAALALERIRTDEALVPCILVVRGAQHPYRP
jgi:hypothetical protein